MSQKFEADFFFENIGFGHSLIQKVLVQQKLDAINPQGQGDFRLAFATGVG